MLQLNYKSGIPICDQIVNGFIRMKALGLIGSGEQLPSVRTLAVELCVNPNTIQKAYQMLENSGIIYTVKGKGSFISDDDAADEAVRKSAGKDFTAAVQRAAELGLTEDALTEIVKKYCRTAERRNGADDKSRKADEKL